MLRSLEPTWCGQNARRAPYVPLFSLAGDLATHRRSELVVQRGRGNLCASPELPHQHVWEFR